MPPPARHLLPRATSRRRFRPASPPCHAARQPRAAGPGLPATLRNTGMQARLPRAGPRRAGSHGAQATPRQSAATSRPCALVPAPCRAALLAPLKPWPPLSAHSAAGCTSSVYIQRQRVHAVAAARLRVSAPARMAPAAQPRRHTRAPPLLSTASTRLYPPLPPLPASTRLYPPLPASTRLYPPLPASTRLYPPLPVPLAPPLPVPPARPCTDTLPAARAGSRPPAVSQQSAVSQQLGRRQSLVDQLPCAPPRRLQQAAGSQQSASSIPRRPARWPCPGCGPCVAQRSTAGDT
jgi:hypothetical protein